MAEKPPNTRIDATAIQPPLAIIIPIELEDTRIAAGVSYLLHNQPEDIAVSLIFELAAQMGAKFGRAQLATTLFDSLLKLRGRRSLCEAEIAHFAAGELQLLLLRKSSERILPHHVLRPIAHEESIALQKRNQFLFGVPADFDGHPDGERYPFEGNFDISSKDINDVVFSAQNISQCFDLTKIQRTVFHDHSPDLRLKAVDRWPCPVPWVFTTLLDCKEQYSYRTPVMLFCQ